MQTIYYSTPNYIRHTGNVVDLAEYRRRQALAQGSLAPQPEPLCQEQLAPELREEPVHHAPLWDRLISLSFEGLACLGIVTMTLTFTLQILGM